ncbi:hypothetical protein D9M72_549270 [compost metagenome]
MEMPAIEIQRIEPLTSWPTKSTSTIMLSDTPSRMIAARRTCRGVRKEIATITTSDGSRKTAWRLTKWKLSRPMRSATAGLAAKDSMKPTPINRMKVARKNLSIVQNQSATGPRSARLTILSVPFSGASCAPRPNTCTRFRFDRCLQHQPDGDVLNQHRHAIDRAHMADKGIAAHLEVLILVEACASRG